jgi:hypothetical protein
MQDRQPELIFHPRDLLSLDGVDRVLCVAPHPDDEVIGCGGLLAAWADRGCAVHVLILTCGQQGSGPAPQAAQAAQADQADQAEQDPQADPGDLTELAARRRQESLQAAVALGTVGMIVASALVAGALAGLTGQNPATLVLGTSPGGIAEMCITAKVLQLGVPTVTALHVIRFVMVLLVTERLWRWEVRRLG